MTVRNQRCLAFVLPLLFVLTLPTWVAAEGWGLPGWGSGSNKSKSSWSWPGTEKKAKSSFITKRNKPTTWEKLSRSTSSTWTKTTSALNPWKKEKASTPARVTGSRRPSANEPKSTWYNPTTWFDEEEKPSQDYRPAGSVSEFLNQPRVPY